MTTVIYFCGLLSLAFALFHIGFWKTFKWNEELKKLDVINRGVMQILNVQITYHFFFVAFICMAFPVELQSTKLGNAFLLGCSLFWVIRTVQQFIFFKANDYATYILTTAFIIAAVLFALPVFVR
ncbi:MAG: hypothetical protein FWE10_00020 [Rikenellaceae bacterium]|nr:hypothetical protein [Rikenellaceae bacterium]MCL2692127.1 hypothetical protein [Rikenellaceae bacterium]